MCSLFFLSFVEIPCVFSFGVAVGLRNSICIFLERFCNLVTNRKSGRVQCLIDVGRWKVRSMAVRVVSSLGRMMGGGMRDGEYFCCYRRKCKWYDKSATTPKISFFKEKKCRLLSSRGGVSAVSKVSNNGSRVWWYFASSYHLGATCKSFPVYPSTPSFQITVSCLLRVISRMVDTCGVAFGGFTPYVSLLGVFPLIWL